MGSKYQLKLEELDGSQSPGEIKKKDLLSSLGEHSTLHGISHWHRARGKVKRDCWITLTVLMSAAMIIHTSLVVWEFTKFEVDIGLSINSESQVKFPTVTVCNVNTVKASAMANSSLLLALLSSTSNTTAAATSPTTSITTSLATSPTTSPTTKKKGKGGKNSNAGGGNSNAGGGGNSNGQGAVQQSFALQQQLTSLLANIPASQKAALGHNIGDFILECTFAGRSCNIAMFSTFFNPIYGNCFSFNSGWNSSYVYDTSRPGPLYGLTLTLNLEQDEYLPELTDIAGARMQVHTQTAMPFVEDQGVSIPPGQASYFGVRRTTIARKPYPYGDCLVLEKGGKYQTQITRDVFEEVYPVRYSKQGCLKTCYQKNVIDMCGCADPQFPMTGTALGVSSMTACDSTNAVQSQCKADVTSLYESNSLTCDCPTVCDEEVYAGDLSAFQWPSDAATNDTKARLAGLTATAAAIVNDADADKYQRNFLQVKVFYLELNTESITEEPAYPFDQFQADFGGIMGLWLGASILSLVEVAEMLVDMMVLHFRKKKLAQGGNDKPSNSSSSKNKVANEKRNHVPVGAMVAAKHGSPLKPRVSNATISGVLVDVEDEDERVGSAEHLTGDQKSPPRYSSLFLNRPSDNPSKPMRHHQWQMKRMVEKEQKKENLKDFRF